MRNKKQRNEKSEGIKYRIGISSEDKKLRRPFTIDHSRFTITIDDKPVGS
jgi:hypothetical protein